SSCGPTSLSRRTPGANDRPRRRPRIARPDGRRRPRHPKLWANQRKPASLSGYWFDKTLKIPVQEDSGRSKTVRSAPWSHAHTSWIGTEAARPMSSSSVTFLGRCLRVKTPDRYPRLARKPGKARRRMTAAGSARFRRYTTRGGLLTRTALVLRDLIRRGRRAL